MTHIIFLSNSVSTSLSVLLGLIPKDLAKGESHEDRMINFSGAKAVHCADRADIGDT